MGFKRREGRRGEERSEGKDCVWRREGLGARRSDVVRLPEEEEGSAGIRQRCRRVWRRRFGSQEASAIFPASLCAGHLI